MRYLGFGAIGVILGVLFGIFSRPEMPLVGQPPIDVALQSLTSGNSMDHMLYGDQFSQHLALVTVVGLVIGLSMAAAMSFFTKSSKH